MTAVNLHDLEWVTIPAGLDNTARLYNLQFATVEDVELVIALDVDTRKAGLSLRSDRTDWVDTQRTADWPAFDRELGRDQWQRFLDNWESNTLEALNANN